MKVHLPDSDDSRATRGADHRRLAGDLSQFSVALVAVASDAMRLAQSLGCSPDEAADVVQESAMAAWRYRETCHTNFRSWFLTIVRRKTTSRPRRWLTLPLSWRHGGQSVVDPSASDAPPPELMRIPPRHRAALWLRYGLDLPIADVASVLGISEPAAKQLLLRARAKLGKELTKTMQEETR